MTDSQIDTLYDLAKESSDILYRFSDIEALIGYKVTYFHKVFKYYLFKSEDSATRKLKSIHTFVKLAKKFTYLAQRKGVWVPLRKAHVLLKISKLIFSLAQKCSG